MAKTNDDMKCVNSLPLEGNTVAPPVVVGQNYLLQGIFFCKCGQEHFDMGLKSKYNYISCYKCKEPIPNGDSIHWCHPSRFIEQ